MEAARAAMEACKSAPAPSATGARGPGSMTPEELEEWRRVPGNEGVRSPDTAARPCPVRPMRVLVRLDPVPGVPLVTRETLAIFVDTHDPEMAESVAEAALHARGIAGEVVS